MGALKEDVRDGSLMKMLYDLALCGKSLDEIMVKCERWKKILEGKGLRENVKTKGEHLLHGRFWNLKFSRWILVVFVVKRLVLTLLGIENVSSGSNVVQMYQGKSVCFPVSMSLSVGYVGIVKKVEIKRGEDLVEEVEMVCDLDDMFSLYGGVFEVWSCECKNV